MKTDIAASITATILAKLEAGTKPWVQPWTGQPLSRPLRHCGAAYRGINTLLLWMTAEERGYSSPYWMTYHQAELLSAHVRRGEKCTHALLYKVLQSQDGEMGDIPPDNYDASDEASPKPRRLLRQYAVFNADQIQGLPQRYYPAATPSAPMAPFEHQARLDAIFASLPAIVHHNGFSAYYNRVRDEIVLPDIHHFTSYAAYFAVRSHETVHWTGAEKRLARTFGTRFGDAAYAMEELVADMGAAILGASLALPHVDLDNHAAYLAAWIKILRHDKHAVLTAASKADEAVDYILGFAQTGGSRIVEREPKLLAA